jgi:hypothetical protein
MKAEALNGSAVISVQDEARNFRRAAQPFSLQKTQEQGLGLAIGRARERAGGRMELERPCGNGRGTKFQFSCRRKVR